MATNTYVALATQILVSNASSVVFNSISNAYTDLLLVVNAIDNRGGGANDDSVAITFNSDTSTGSTNYSYTNMLGNGSSASSGRSSNSREVDAYSIGTTANATPGTIIFHVMDYKNTTTFKTVLTRGGNASAVVGSSVGTWRNTAAISTITLYPGYNGSGYNFLTGSTFSLYGIAAIGVTPAPKATGGVIYSDTDYYYHVFGSTGVFTPNTNITNVDYLVLAGGAGGGGGVNSAGTGGGGGAGGLRSTIAPTGGGGTAETKITLTSGTAYTITVGAGGAAGTGTFGTDTAGQNGNASSIAGSGLTTITALAGGGGGGALSAPRSGTFGSGGGAGNGNINGQAGTANQGYAGGLGATYFNGAPVSGGGGGGGAGGIGSAGLTTGSGGAGGAGGSGVSISGWATATGTGVSGSYAGGGGGGGSTGGSGNSGSGAGGSAQGIGNSALANTGGGGGGGATNNTGGGDINGGSGGSGLIILRYLKA